ncbi:MAG: YidC/Oxa1 family membrane protein insertase [Clostridia bacterium]|jgi:YidC/Oxa1 family membrane protein insertase|nr:membrane protein insertase YidC/Oxa1 family [Clostridium sp. CAG:571]HJJ06608.1 YidC/Oxa1 family membrane protein insertase [Clostridiaceae bacterium]HJJ13893.1 YidC/Oxa1 family membrane protein insertase [Clostridiaceae bacterium]
MGVLSNLFGYVLNALYDIFNNYGIAIILFSIILRVILIPITISQQSSMKKTSKIQKQTQELQKKYKNNQEKMNQELMELYKKEKINPFSGCFSAIIQIVIILSVFWLVSQPLTYMKHVQDMDIYKEYLDKVEEGNNKSYKEIAILNMVESDYQDIVKQLENGEENKEKLENRKNELNKLRLNMNFLGLDLSKVPTQSLNDYKVYIIPILYVISSFVSIKMTTNMQNNKEDKKETSGENASEIEAMQSMNKSMTYMMPIMSVSIAVIAPLGLALYWLVSNVLMIVERLIIQKIMNSKEENENA